MIYTVCGLYVDQDEPQLWGAGSFVAEDVDSADTAVMFTRVSVQGEPTVAGGDLCSDFALAAVHPGLVDRLGEIEMAEMEINHAYVLWARLNEPREWFWVNGISAETWQTLHYKVCAHGPDMAYLEARKRARLEGHTFLYACTHSGDTDWIEGFPYGRFPYTT